MAKKDQLLADRIEEAIRKNESLEALTTDNVRRDVARAKITEQKGKNAKLIKMTNQRNKTKAAPEKSSSTRTKATSGSALTSSKKSSATKSGKTSAPVKSSKTALKVSKLKSSPASRSQKAPSGGKSQKAPSGGKKYAESRKSSGAKPKPSKLSVVGFRGRASYSSNKKDSLRSS